ncbi:phosphate/phosphite/phosphonate ABC transporter substrate-binding protein [Acidihalobacter prosperus]|uniref:Phosphonate ABC transporter substrate-binding protein n=1 Tax=Acidihalobacter prosperus TaxID=160660 RepID=A0A1A6C7G2_9GAMM|nr:phosphate/phosphite/phosphonate ABC transporter substrate-binding protein [Acidihalobacter prosperus]OBS10503.1 hypothetical protein Thpro_020219 [Acidihalobacter prosperus]
MSSNPNPGTARARLAAHCLLLLLVWISPGHAQPANPPQTDGRWLRFGVLPLQSPTKLADMFMPLVEYLQRSLHRPVQFVTAPSFTIFMQRVMHHDYDIVYLNPLLFTQAEKAGYDAVAKVLGEPFTGILVVRRDSPLHGIDPAQWHKGLIVGFPDPRAYAATVMTRGYLRTHGVDVTHCCRIRYFGSQDSVLMALNSGLVGVAGTWWPSLRSMPPAIRRNLRVIAETPPQPQMPIAVLDSLPAALRQDITASLLALHTHPRDRAILSKLGFPQGFIRARNAEYREVK